MTRKKVQEGTKRSRGWLQITGRGGSPNKRASGINSCIKIRINAFEATSKPPSRVDATRPPSPRCILLHEPSSHRAPELEIKYPKGISRRDTPTHDQPAETLTATPFYSC